MRSPKKRHSWPPARKPRSTCEEDYVDSNPFAYFISPVEDSIFYLEGTPSAGIYIKPRSRSLPPLRSKKLRIQLSISTTSILPISGLKRWIERMEKQYFHRSYRDTDMPDPIIEVIEPRQKLPVPRTEPVIIPISPSVRGRGDARSGSRQRRVGNNGRTPPRRPRVWREPSSGIWSVAEEDEDATPGLGITV